MTSPLRPDVGTDLPAPLDPLEAVDRFLQNLPACDDVARQLRLALDTVRTGTRADVVLLFNASAGVVTDHVGASLPEDAADLARRLVAANQRQDCPVLQGGREAAPHSAALVRLSRSRGVWLVALRLTPEHPFSARDLRLMKVTRRLLVQQQQQGQGHDQLREVLFGLVRCLTATLDARDPYTCGHSERVARIATRLGQEMRLPPAERGDLYLGGLLHDIGKVGLMDEVLRKPGRLTEDEFALVRQHVIIGDSIISHVRQLAHLRPLVRSHHERWDGRGYPDGLAGEDIPLPARILAVADGCDAMLSDRPYRPGMPPDAVAAVLDGGAGSQWDPEVVAAFRSCRAEVFAIGQRGLGDSVVRAIEDTLREGSPEAARSFRAVSRVEV